jgi:alpha-galactosidase
MMRILVTTGLFDIDMAVFIGAVNKEDFEKVSYDDYFQDTWADWRAVDPNLAKKLLDALMQRQRKKGGRIIRKDANDFVEIDGVRYYYDFRSERKSAFFRSRSFSFYFRVPSKRSVIRISDHWSKTAYTRSGKLNCGWIRSCYWSNFKGIRFSYRLSGEKYESEFVAGIATLASFKRKKINALG